MHPLLLVCAACLLGRVSASDAQATEGDICSMRDSCVDCIRTPNCAWCGNPKLGSLTSSSVPERCQALDTVTPDWCGAENIIDELPAYAVLEDKPLHDSKDGEVVQLAPQRVKLRLRVGKPYELKVRYRHAQDYPVDLYYLMDLSASMKDDKEKLSDLGDSLATAMQNITTNFRLGFGSFVDKVAMPFTSTTPEKLKNPCSKEEPCAAPFSFRNNLALTTNTPEFKKEVKKANVSGNLDSPEGGLDALMQTIVCKEIGWREKARRMIIFSTDAPFHIAGDGKLAGIVEPNDGLCHLDENGMYTAGLNFDYPSISQISHKAHEKSTHVIFAVTKNFSKSYKILSQRIDGSSVRELDKDSSNVVDLVVEEYKKLSDSVELTDNHGNNLEVRYFTKCLNSSQEETEKSKCEGLKRGIEVVFNVRITVTSCQNTGDLFEKQEFNIYPVGINEEVKVELEVICGCDCNKGSMSVMNSTTCNNRGDLECGLCKCYQGFLGDHCDCESDSNSPTMQETSGCKNERNETCSGHGTCVCNSCQCTLRPNRKEKYEGRLCECDNFSCKRHEGKVCAGHGKCSCGQCICYPGWSGEACECADTKEGCRPRGDTTICSGRGYCECGQCTCNLTKDGHLYSGQYCEECPSCPGALCKDFEVCAESKLNNTKLPTSSKCGYVVVVDNIRAKDEKDYDSYDSDQDKICPVADGQGCIRYFRYRFMSGAHRIWVQKEKECGPNITGIIFGVIGATVLLGLLIILIWKICTTIHDKREYAKFEKERALSKWDRGGNPLYQPSTSTFTNPTFKKS